MKMFWRIANIFNQVAEEAQLLSHVDNLGIGAAIITAVIDNNSILRLALERMAERN